MSGTYCLLVHLDTDAIVEVGALGPLAFPEGWYSYVGSARGPGGFARLDRHREVATGRRDRRHWHLDYLLDQPAASVVDDVRTPGADAECAVADALDGERVEEFGCSDCGCGSHLFQYGGSDRARTDARRAHAAAAQAGTSR